MKRKKKSWMQSISAKFGWGNSHRRVCCKCKKPITKHHRWHHKGWHFLFIHDDRPQHNDCKNPRMETLFEVSQRLGPELPFSGGAEIRSNIIYHEDSV